jgi:hypothetical protein
MTFLVLIAEGIISTVGIDHHPERNATLHFVALESSNLRQPTPAANSEPHIFHVNT